MSESNKGGTDSAPGRDVDAPSPKWTPITTVAESRSVNAPGCTRFNGADWAVWNVTERALWCSTNNGGGWSAAVELDVDNYVCFSQPVITEHDGTLYLLWDMAGDPRIYYATYDGSEWVTSPGHYIPGSYTTSSPAAVSWNGKLYVAWASGDDSTLSYSWFDGQNWYSPQKTSYNILYGPALAVFDNTLFSAIMFSSSRELAPLRYVNDSWVKWGSVPDAQIYNSPALASDGDKLLLMWNDDHTTNLMTSTLADAESQAWTPAAGTAPGMMTYIAPVLCGDSAGFRAVWTGKEQGYVQTSTLASSQPTPPPPTTDRPVPPEIDNADGNNVSGVTGYNYYVTITVNSKEGEQLTKVQTQAESNGSWAYTLDYTLTKGMTVQAVVSKDKDSTASYAYVKVIDQFQTGPLSITSVETDQVSGVAPDTGQVIKAWRQSDGALMVLYPVPAASPETDGKTFTAPYVGDMKLAAGDLLCVVSQFPKDGTMTPFNSQYEGYPGS